MKPKPPRRARSAAVPTDASFDPSTSSVQIASDATQEGFFGLLFHVNHLPPRSVTLRKESTETLRWSSMAADGVSVELEIRRALTGCGWVAIPRLVNKGSEVFEFTSYGFKVAPASQGPRIGVDAFGPPLYASSSNLRHEKLPFCGADFPFARTVPMDAVSIGGEPCGSVSALFLGRHGSDRWLGHAALTQERHLLRWNVSLSAAKGRQFEFESSFFWTGGHPEVVQPGEEVTLESSLFWIREGPIDSIYSLYIDELSALHGARLAGVRSALRRSPVYCTWNYGVFKSVTEADCLKRMEVVATAQKGGFFQIDDGYQPPKAKGGEPTSFLDAYYPDPDKAWDPERFPSGPRGFVKSCLSRGLRPAIWWTPMLDKDGPILREHPEWRLNERSGALIDEVGYPMLDYSLPEARAFIEKCVGAITREWGFQGMKLDFFSWSFDHPNAHFKRGGTGTRWKRWLFKLIRDALGPDGYFLHCISCPLGDPLLALDGPDAYRAGIDIHSGEWNYHVKGSSWLLPGMLANNSGTFYGNMDSWMGSPDIPMDERRSRLAFGYMTAGMAEFSGPVERLDGQALADYATMVERLDAGDGFECPEREPFLGEPFPRILIRRHARTSAAGRGGVTATLGIFNWSDERMAFAVNTQDHRLAGAPCDFWTSRPLENVKDGLLALTLAPRGHALVDFKIR